MAETRQIRVEQFADAVDFNLGHFVNTDKLRFYLSTFTPNQNSTAGDFDTNRVLAIDIADITLSAAWASGLDIQGRATNIYSALLDVIPAGTATFPIIAGGWYIVDSVGTVLKAHGAFDVPVTWTQSSDQLLLKPFIYCDFLTNSDAEFLAGP